MGYTVVMENLYGADSIDILTRIVKQDSNKLLNNDYLKNYRVSERIMLYFHDQVGDTYQYARFHGYTTRRL